jgi:hemerythrin superfamily protein
MSLRWQMLGMSSLLVLLLCGPVRSVLSADTPKNPPAVNGLEKNAVLQSEMANLEQERTLIERLKSDYEALKKERADVSDTSTLIVVLLPIGTLLLGFGTKSLSDYFEFNRTKQKERDEKEQDRQARLIERRNTSQRRTLMDLQGASYAMAIAISEISTTRLEGFKTSDSWAEITLAKANEETRNTVARAEVLQVRVLDTAVRQLWLKFDETITQAMHGEDKQEVDTALDNLIEISDQINDRIGTLLRDLDGGSSNEILILPQDNSEVGKEEKATPSP